MAQVPPGPPVPNLYRLQWAAQAPPEILALDDGTYGVSYDLYTNDLEWGVPNGWQVHRATIYERICRHFRHHGYDHGQYSVWQMQGRAQVVWHHMMDLRNILPLGIIQSVTRAMQLFKIPHQVCIVDHDIKLGGRYSPGLIAPTPRELARNLLPYRIPPAAPPRTVRQVDNAWPRRWQDANGRWRSQLPQSVPWTNNTINPDNWWC